MDNYARILRTIGQDLEARNVKYPFYIECRNDQYRVWSKNSKAQESQLRRALKEFHRPHKAKQPQNNARKEDSRALYFSGSRRLLYQMHDLQRLEGEGEAKRREPNGMPDPYSVSQLLRALGNYVRLKAAGLLAISWTEDFIGLVYETAEGRREVENLRLPSIYDLWVHMYLRRQNANIQLLRHAHMP